MQYVYSNQYFETNEKIVNFEDYIKMYELYIGKNKLPALISKRFYRTNFTSKPAHRGSV